MTCECNKEQATAGIITGSDQLVEGGVPRTRNKVAIVGFAPSTMNEVRHVWDDPDMEIWSINQLYMAFPEIVPKTTRWFQIHSRRSYDQTVGRDHSHHEWMANQKDQFLIYMQEKQPDIPMSVKFPKDEILQMFGRYFTNSISWEIALAIAEGFKEIHIYGVDMATDDEHAFERPSVEYFCGWARGAGINLVIPEKSDLLKSMWLYPYEDDSVFRTKLQARRVELRERIGVLGSQEQGLRDQRMHLIGAAENMNYVQKCWSDNAKEFGLQGKIS